MDWKILKIIPTWALITIIVLLISMLGVAIKLGSSMIKKVISNFVDKIEVGFNGINKRFDTVDGKLELADIHREAQDQALDKILPENGTSYMKEKNTKFDELLARKSKEKELSG